VAGGGDWVGRTTSCCIILFAVFCLIKFVPLILLSFAVFMALISSVYSVYSSPRLSESLVCVSLPTGKWLPLPICSD